MATPGTALTTETAAPDFRTSSGEVLRALVDRFVVRFLVRTLLFSAAVVVVGFSALVSLVEASSWVITTVTLLASLGTCLALAKQGHVRRGAQLYPLVGIVGLVVCATMPTPPLSLTWMGVALVGVLAATAFLLPARQVMLALVGGVGGLALAAAILINAGSTAEEVAPPTLAASTLAVLVVVAIRYFVRHHIAALGMLQTRMDEVEDVMATASRIADGNLDVAIQGDSLTSVTVARMLESLRRVVEALDEQIESLGRATTEIGGLARRQESEAASQAAAVEEVRHTLGALSGSSQSVSEATELVFAAVDETRINNELIERRLIALQQQASRIGELAELIRGVASRSELLALNAALEGVRAGEAGRGFGLVAAEMQRHAENVSRRVADVRQLVEDIDRATQAAVEASHRGTELAVGATEAATRIRTLSRTQRVSASEASESMDDIGRAAQQVNESSRDTLEAIERLEALAASLREVLRTYQSPDDSKQD